MQLAPLRIAEPARGREQHANRLKGGERAGPPGHSPEHAVLGAGVAIVGVERVADEAAVARLVGQVPGEGADLFVSIGTSGAVYPAAGFVQQAKSAGARTLELNLERSQGSAWFDESRLGPASELVPAWVEEMLR